ncbi:hypothetical protein [Thiobacillus sp.]|uniref:hypothetical protein n=1 Tax=Thiobacillus sp. TaxID=924 RepID=UPI00178E7E9E|nr:hypothetical protein [Thiobacillus sp.]MBC2732066.1 hypothetical protein [Thiobacillus sp.]MBC2740804.1 hypothetical protein [Thiobacillus sp.]MBC2759436.1 hypothetical protein [Thiobacillus sp.]
MNTTTFQIPPREIKVALMLLWIALFAGAASLIPMFVNNWSVISDQPADWWIQILWGYPLNIMLLLALAQGYGWIRWLLTIALTLMFFSLLVKFKEWSQLHEQLGIFLYVEPIVFISRCIAIVLLFRPESNIWYARRRSATPA